MFKQKFALKLKQIRKSRKFTQEKLAELVGVDFRYISLLENAKSFPSCELIEKLALALNVTYREMFDFDNDFSRIDIEKEIINTVKNIDDKNLKILYSFSKQLL
ncbi:helix-turn-helix transcriptional regulator [bacterium]|nr:helix-turn-helix transcriptional regulator [bacterium]